MSITNQATRETKRAPVTVVELTWDVGRDMDME